MVPQVTEQHPAACVCGGGGEWVWLKSVVWIQIHWIWIRIRGKVRPSILKEKIKNNSREKLFLTIRTKYYLKKFWVLNLTSFLSYNYMCGSGSTTLVKIAEFWKDNPLHKDRLLCFRYSSRKTQWASQTVGTCSCTGIKNRLTHPHPRVVVSRPGRTRLNIFGQQFTKI